MTKKVDNLALSLIFLIIGGLLFMHPDMLVKLITYVVGAVFIAVGISKILKYYKQNKTATAMTSDFIVGLVAIVIGITAIICSNAIEFATRLVLGVWLLYAGIVKLINSFNLKAANERIWSFTLILAILMIMCGLYIILVSNLAIKLIGLILIIYAIFEIIQYITLPKNLNPDIIKNKKNEQKSIDLQ